MTYKTTSTSSAQERYNTWTALIASARQGDKKSYNQFLNDFSHYAKSVIASKLLRQEWIDDVCQTILISVHKALPTYDGERPLKPFLDAIIRFRLNDALREYYNHRETQEIDELREGEGSHAAQIDARTDVYKALEELPEAQRKVIEMTKLKGYSIKDVSDETGMSESAVKVSVHRGLKKMRQFLEQQDVA